MGKETTRNIYANCIYVYCLIMYIRFICNDDKKTENRNDNKKINK